MLPGIGIFGTGDIVRSLIPFLRSKGFRVEAVWGRTLEAAESVAQDLEPVPFYTNKVDDVLLRKDVDLVFIMCQPDLHTQIAVKALGIGKHVLCDRPAGLCQIEVLKMVNAAQYYPSLISVIAHGLRFLPAFVQVKRLLSEGHIGKLHLCDVRVHCGSLIGDNFDWMCSQLMGGGILTMVGSHIIDIISYITNQKAIRAHGILKTFTKSTDKINGIRWIDSDDFSTFQMVLEKDVCVTVTLNSHIPGQFQQEIILCGSKGRLVIRDSNLYYYKEPCGKEEVLHEETNTSNSKNKDSHASNLPHAYLQGLFQMIGALKEAFATGDNEHDWLKEPVSNAATFEDGQYVQAVIDTIKLSSTSRQWEQVNVTSEESKLNPLKARLNLSNINLSSFEALSQASISKPPVQRKGASTDSHLWSFGVIKH